jgi:hypothetical protein
MKKPHVIFLGGYLCSGKGTFIKDNLFNHHHIAVSSIVRSIVKASTRAELQDTAHLDKVIGQRIVDAMANEYKRDGTKQFVVDGIRQLSIYTFVSITLANWKWTCENVWLEVSIGECKRRFEAKNDTAKENISFEQAFENDKKLGLLQLEDFWKTTYDCTLPNE